MRRWGVGALVAVIAFGGRAAEVAPNLAVKAIITGSEEGPEGYELKRAFDGDYDTRWGGAKGDKAWIDFAWKRPVSIRRVALCEWGRRLKKLTVQTVGANGWETVAALPPAAGPDAGNVTALDLPKPLTGKHMRLLMDGRAVSLYEVRLSGVPAAALTGVVTDARTMEPVAGAVVTLLPSGEMARADARGRYRLAAEPGTYAVQAERAIGADGRGYEAQTASVRMGAAGAARDFRLLPVRGARRLLEGVVPLSTFDVRKTQTASIPLDVPAGVARLTLRLLDLQPASGSERPAGSIEPFYRSASFALFDPRGVGPFSFRGLGMSRNTTAAVLSPGFASPGWVAGPIPPGRWTLLCQSSPDSVDMRYRMEVTFQMGAAAPARPAPPRATAALDPGPNWFKGDFHAHTDHSADATIRLKRLIADRRAAGYDFISLTDHSTVSGHSEAARLAGGEKPLVIMGEDVTTAFGNLNILGTPAGWWADYRIQPGDDSLPRLIDAVHAAGGQVSLDLPEAPIQASVRFGWDPRLDAMEAWNGDDAATSDRLETADRLYSAHQTVPLIGGSGVHHASDAAGPVTWVYADELSAKSILAAVKAGHASMTRSFDDSLFVIEADADGDGKFEASVGDTVHIYPDHPIKMRARVAGWRGKTLRLATSDGIRVVPFDADFDWVEFWQDEGTTFVRAEMVEQTPSGPPHYLALTNPIYVR
ncbi:MAG TPA: CehA/McbA family metallohydrolase [Armatimonadota bacterium]|jgi:hypothetical protein